MTARVKWDGVEAAYAAAEAWIDRGLRNDDSVFTPGRSIWTRELLGELHHRFLDRPDDSSRPFLEKLKDQLEGSPPEVYQLMGEVLFVHYLLLDPNEPAIRTVLEWSPSPVNISPELVDGLQFLFINIGVAKTLIPFQLGTLIETVEQWKDLDPGARDRLLDDPWDFKEFLFSRHFTSQLLANKQNTGRLERHLLLHIIFPTPSRGSCRTARTASPEPAGSPILSMKIPKTWTSRSSRSATDWRPSWAGTSISSMMTS